MYSREKVAQGLAQAAEAYHFTPVPHSVADVSAFESHLIASGRYVYDEMGNPTGTQNLTAEESTWMLNERQLVACDAAYALTRYGFIKDEQNVIRRFEFRIPQRLLFDIIADLEGSDSAVELMVLKARQLGVSTLIILLVALRIIFGYGINAIIGSADQTKTALMANMLFLFYDMLPVWLRPKWTRRVESDRGMLVFGHSSSGVSFQHGAQTSGIARGTTPTVYLLSECASFTDPVNQIEASLFKAVHASPNVFGILESTGEGDKGWWPDTWRHAKANWPLRRSRLCPKFLPWFCGVDLYPTVTWLRMRPPAPDWRPNRETRLHVAKCELYVHSDPHLAKYLGAAYRMPREQQWYWEVEHEQAKAKNIEGVFLQEMAGDDEEALQRSAVSAFGHDTILQAEERRKRDYDVYGISGQSIEADHEPLPEDTNYDAKRIVIRHTTSKGEAYRWELVPLRFASPLRESDPEDAGGKLFIFHHPHPGMTYSIGVDTSEGKGEDSTAVSVWTVGAKGEPDIQCAEFASSYVNHIEAFAFVFVIAKYYGQYMAAGVTRWREPYVSIEQVAAVGDVCQVQMAKMGYHNFHRMSRYDSSLARIAQQKMSRSSKRGWYTFGWSRAILTGYFVNCARNGWVEINSPWLIEEMKHWEVHVTKTGREKYEHEEGEHDDRIFAACMAVFCPHDTDPVADRSKKRSVVEPGTLQSLDLGPAADSRIISTDSPAFKESLAETLDDVISNPW